MHLRTAIGSESRPLLPEVRVPRLVSRVPVIQGISMTVRLVPLMLLFAVDPYRCVHVSGATP